MWIVVLTALLLAAPAPAPAQGGAASLLRGRLEWEAPGMLAADEVRRFYAARGYEPAWSTEAAVRPQAEALLRALGRADDHGLDPAAYRLGAIARARTAAEPSRPGAGLDAPRRVELDLLLTDAMLGYAEHLARGRVDPARLHAGWGLPPRAPDPVPLLATALQAGRLEAALAGLPPATPAYRGLAAALARYRAIAARGGWPPLEGGPTLSEGDRGPRVAALRARLAAESAVLPADSPHVFDAGLAAAVRLFQRSHGLVDDGKVGPATRAALNVPAAARIEQIALSLERARWLPDDLGRRHIRVHIPGFELEVVEEGRVVLDMRVIGGRPDWRTPVFSASLTGVVLSPYWNIPPSIARQEVIPKVRRDRGYLVRNGIRVLAVGSGRVVSAGAVSWSSFDHARFRLRQDPGPLNPLGKVKFDIANRYNVYLHDTSNPELFARPVRALSHGCMRVEKPVELAEYVLAGVAGWGPAAMREAMGIPKERRVALPDPIRVHVLYQTAWIDRQGRLQLREDLYGHDARLAALLRHGGDVTTLDPRRDDCAAG